MGKTVGIILLVIGIILIVATLLIRLLNNPDTPPPPTAPPPTTPPVLNSLHEDYAVNTLVNWYNSQNFPESKTRQIINYYNLKYGDLSDTPTFTALPFNSIEDVFSYIAKIKYGSLTDSEIQELLPENNTSLSLTDQIINMIQIAVVNGDITNHEKCSVNLKVKNLVSTLKVSV